MFGRVQPSSQTWAISGPFRPVGRLGWIAELPSELHGLADGNEAPYRSRLQLFEGEQLLGPAHALHASIENSGGGAYSFWDTVLYFSSSDGTDPNLNGCSYAAALVEPHRQSKHLKWDAPPRLLRCAIIGLGNRGTALGQLAGSLPGVEIAWVADQSIERLAEVSGLFGLGAKTSTDFSVPLADPQVDIVFVMVPDDLHREVAEAAFEKGKHVFLEKPIATTAGDAKAILNAWQRSGRVLQLGYVLRQAPYYAAIRDVIRRGLLGPVRIANLSEQLDVRHGGSFMRRWHRRAERSGGLMVHKGCHDLDIVCWLLDTRPRTVASFGGQGTFAQPAPAEFCSVCSRRSSCPYVDAALHERRAGDELHDPSAYGLDRCVFNSEKDIVDHQVVAFELEAGMRGTFTLAMQGPRRSERKISLIGDGGTLEGIFEDGHFVINFTDRSRPPYVWTADERSRSGHGGGDGITVLEFLNACIGRVPPPIRSSEEAVRGLTFALAAERSRKSNNVVVLTEEDFVSS